MPAVVTFWQTLEDETNFLRFLEGTGPILALPDRWVKTREEVVPRPAVRYILEDDPEQVLLGLAEHVRRTPVEARDFKGEAMFALPYTGTCLLAYRRGRMRGGSTLGQSNLAADWSYFDSSGRLVQKDPLFVEWGQKVLTWARAMTPERVNLNGHPYRATKRVKDAVSRGELQVAL